MSPNHKDGDSERARDVRSPAPSAFEADMLALLPTLRRYSRSLTRSDFECEDLLQDCVEKALSNRTRWHGDNLRSWICTIMTNLYRNRHRNRTLHRSESLDDHPQLPAPDMQPDTLQNDRLHRLLATLAPEARAVLMLVVIEGYTYQEVATMLDIPLGTVMSRLSRARETLRGKIKADNVIDLRRPT